MAQYHGTCSTAAGTAAKVVTCSEFTRNTGSRIAVKFSAANTAASPSLNVNGTGAAAIWQDGAAAASGCWKANETCLFEFDGTYWNLLKGKGGVSAWTDISGACPVSKGGTGATSAAAALAALGGAKMALYNATVGTGWSTNSSGGYKITVSVSGITANDVPVVGVKMSDDVSAATNQGKAFACINRITTAANSITCYAFTTKPTTSISIQLLVVRNA